MRHKKMIIYARKGTQSMTIQGKASLKQWEEIADGLQQEDAESAQDQLRDILSRMIYAEAKKARVRS